MEGRQTAWPKAADNWVFEHAVVHCGAMLVRPLQMTDLQAGYVALEERCQAIEGEREQYKGA